MNNGFFPKQETESKTRPNGKRQSCAACGNYRDCITPKMKPYGNFRKSILIIGDAPDMRSDQMGIPFSGPVGRHLRTALAELGIDLEHDCLSTYSNLCRCVDSEGNDRLPSNLEIDSCRSQVLKTIDKYAPKVIILLGIQVVYSVIGHRWKKDFGAIEKWRGWTIPDQTLFSWVCPVMSPSVFESGKRDTTAEMTIWMQDLQRAVEMVDVKFPRYREPVIHYIEDLSILNDLKSDCVAIDFETTGLKWHAKGHKIVSCAIATDENTVYAFLVPKKRVDRAPLIRILTNNLVSKIIANAKYEYSWAKGKLGCEIKNIAFDTMLCSHILDNRAGVTGLKFQVFVQFGIDDYSSELDQWLHTGGKDGNEINRIMELIETEEGVHKLLTYNSMDSIFEYRLALLQMKKINFQYLPF